MIRKCDDCGITSAEVPIFLLLTADGTLENRWLCSKCAGLDEPS